ncbi:DUF1564 domain-containing protein [Leptospira alstonii]|uniref:PF07600 family protein n=2 Tax=Leptospira alstonii TaxID=28452 RepID=M6CQK1_9LEPT|nr:DUF1564 domain-containing protein [Leptospira alstonii]EMJ93969.1 PF07600 family protein [Leptospira alstonii serovar Sichuan str. 79601]EQA79580.1 PF07600 family protein [Leptospira alstonii serovar Pingchang str. 80-412]
MGYLSFSSDFKLSSKLQEAYSETVTLLIPEETWRRYSEKEAKKLPQRIPTLLKKYGKYLSATPRLGKKAGRTLYQPSLGAQKMKRVNARLNAGSWTFFGALAQAHGVSRCYLFNYLLWLETVGVGDSIERTMNEGVPTFHRNYSYILDVDLLNNRVTRRLHYEPESHFYTFNYTECFPS